MIESMTGFGQSEKTENGITISIETRSVNNRFMEIFLKTPQQLNERELEIKDIVKENFSRGKINIIVSLSKEKNNNLKVNSEKAKKYFVLLKKLKKTIGAKDEVTLSNLLEFSDIFETEKDSFNEKSWELFVKVLNQSLGNLKKMRLAEGLALKEEFIKSIVLINSQLGKIEKLSKENISSQKEKIKERVKQIVEDKNIINSQRVEMEILLLSDKLDISEEIIRFRTHNKYFTENLNSKESQGRKLNFLIQEMGREANTIGSKSNDAKIAHLVVSIKEELEKIREQLQNIE